jgi:hypothetical protein
VFVGLVSYPLYLWHWPLLAFPTIVGAIDEPGVRISAVALAMLLAVATYGLLERPLRHARTITVPASLMAGSLGCLALGLAIAGGTLRPRLDGPEHADISAAAGDWSYPDGLTRITTPSGIRLYTFGSGTDKVLFFGDSNVEQYWPRVEALVRSAPERRTIIFATVGGCPPIPGVARTDNPRCQGFAQNVVELARDPTIRTVVLAAQWRGHFLTGQISIDGGTPVGPPRAGTPEAKPIFARLRAMVGEMRALGKEVWIVLQIPFGRAPAGWLERGLDGRAEISIRDTPRKNAEANWLPIRDELVAIARDTGAGLIDPMEWLCDEVRCRTRTDDGKLVHYDRAHLRASYVREHATALDATINGPPPSSAKR